MMQIFQKTLQAEARETQIAIANFSPAQQKVNKNEVALIGLKKGEKLWIFATLEADDS